MVGGTAGPLPAFGATAAFADETPVGAVAMAAGVRTGFATRGFGCLAAETWMAGSIVPRAGGGDCGGDGGALRGAVCADALTLSNANRSRNANRSPLAANRRDAIHSPKTLNKVTARTARSAAPGSDRPHHATPV
jgi:hypothetical protein